MAAAPTSAEWIRVRRVGQEAVVETAARRYTSPESEQRVEVVGMVHLAEDAYWTAMAATPGDRVLYESILDASLLDGESRLVAPIAATASARRAAEACGLAAQSDALGVVASEAATWRVADLTAQELAAAGAPEGAPGGSGGLAEALAVFLGGGAAVSEDAGRGRVEERFGSGVARALCALAPAPELALTALDWRALQRGASGVDDDVVARAFAAAVLDVDGASLAKLSLLRSLLAGAGGARSDAANAPVVLGKRNDRVLARLFAGPAGDAAVLYGVAHMRDLDAKLRQAGYERSARADWTRAFGVPLESGKLDDRTSPLVVLAPALLLLLALDGADYVVTLLDAFRGVDPLALALGLYYARHAALYYGLKKWLVP